MQKNRAVDRFGAAIRCNRSHAYPARGPRFATGKTCVRLRTGMESDYCVTNERIVVCAPLKTKRELTRGAMDWSSGFWLGFGGMKYCFLCSPHFPVYATRI